MCLSNFFINIVETEVTVLPEQVCTCFVINKCIEDCVLPSAHLPQCIHCGQCHTSARPAGEE